MAQPALDLCRWMGCPVQFHRDQVADPLEAEVGDSRSCLMPFHPVVIILDRTTIQLIAEYAVRRFGEFALELQLLQICDKVCPAFFPHGIIWRILSSHGDFGAKEDTSRVGKVQN